MTTDARFAAGPKDRAFSPLLPPAILILLTLLVFGRVVTFHFLDWDDQTLVASNPDFQTVHPLRLRHYWMRPYLGMYMPVTYSTWGMLAMLTQTAPDEMPEPPSPAAFHALNLAVHLTAVLLAYAILMELVGRRWPAALGAAIFAIHPLQVEAVAWVAGFSAVLSGALALAAIWAYLRHVRPQDSWWFIVATGFYILAMLAKPSAVVIPLIAGAINLGLLGRKWNQVWPALTKWAVLAVPVIIIASRAQPAVATWPLYARPLLALDAKGFYLCKLAWPALLLPDYGRSPQWVLEHSHWLLTSLVALGAASACWLTRRKLPAAAIAFLVFFLAVLPTLGLLPFRFQQYSTVADRYAYLAMLGPALAVAYLLDRINWHWALAPAICIIALLGLRSAIQLAHWEDTFSLFNYTLEKNPRSMMSYKVLAFAYDFRKQPTRAIELYQSALTIQPDNPDTHFNYGNTLASVGRPAEAIEHYRIALTGWPNIGFVHEKLALALAQDGKPEEADKEFRTLLDMAPNNAFFLAEYGTFLAKQGRDSEAVAVFQRALKIEPHQPQALWGMRLLRKEPPVP